MMVDVTKLIGGPYPAPEVERGDWLHDERFGLVEVGGWTDAPIPWPRLKKTGKHAPILTGALVDAVRVESESAVAHHWGVGLTTVWAWRKALGVGRVTPGTHALYQEYQPEKLPPEVAAKGLVSIAMRADPGDDPPSRSVSMQMQWADGRRQHVGAWTDGEVLSMLKMHVAGRRDRDIAAALGRSLHAVRSKRRAAMGENYDSKHGMVLRGYAKPHSIDWTLYDDIVGIVPDRTIAILLGCTYDAVAKRRRKIGREAVKRTITQIDWDQWEHLLGTMPDAELARKIGCSTQCVHSNRKQLGIPKYKKHKA